jgi:hypothetical protein
MARRRRTIIPATKWATTGRTRTARRPVLDGPASLQRRAAVARVATVLLALLVLLAVVGCQPAPSETPVGWASNLPAPSGAVLDVGRSGPGQDSLGPFVAYRSMDPPAVALERYATDLARAGFELVRQVGTWRVFQRGAVVVSVSVSADGPPTYIIVREGSAQTGGGNGAPGPSIGPNRTPEPPGLGTPEPVSRRPSTPPGHGGTPPGQASTPPGHGGTPPGQASTPPGHGGTPPGQASTPPGQGGGNGTGSGGSGQGKSGGKKP